METLRVMGNALTRSQLMASAEHHYHLSPIPAKGRRDACMLLEQLARSLASDIPEAVPRKPEQSLFQSFWGYKGGGHKENNQPDEPHTMESCQTSKRQPCWAM